MAFKLTEVKKSHQLLNENEQLKNKKEKDKYDKPVFRATQIGDKETFNYFLAEYEVGNVVENFGFWSATKHYIPYDKSLIKNKEEADTQLVYMQIDGYSGKEVLYGEIIFPRHKQFLVTARRISDLNVTQIILKEIDPI